MKRQLLSVLALCGFTVFPAFAGSCGAELAMVNAPKVRQGDSWTYALKKKSGTSSVTEDVVKVSPNRIVVKMTTETGQWTRYHTRGWAWIARGEMKQPEIKFPLSVGMPEVPATRSYSVGNETFHVRETHEVLGCERVKTEAGEFETVKIRVQGSYSATGSGTDAWSGSQETLMWYAPAARRYVRYESRSDSPTGRFQWVKELQQFRLVTDEIASR